MSDVIEYVIRLRDELSGKVEGATDKVNIFKETMMGVAGGIAAAFAVDKIIDFTKSVVETGAKMETLNNVINYTSGTAAEAAKNHAFLKRMVEEYKLPIVETTEGFSQFNAALMGSVLQGEDARKIYEGVSVGITAMHLDAEKANRVFMALNQMVSKGTVASEELKSQLGEAMPGAFRLAAEAMGMTTAELTKHLEKGEIIANDFLPKFAAKLKEQYGAAIPTAIESTTAKMTELSNAQLQLKEQLFTGLEPIIKIVTEKMIGLVNAVRSAVEWWQRNSETIGAVVKFLLIAVTPLAVIIGLYKTWVIVTEALAVVQGVLNAVLAANPIILVAAAIGLIIAAFVTAYEQCDQFRAVMQGLGAVLLSLWPILKGTGEIIGGMLTFNGDMLMAGLNDFKTGLVNAMPSNLMSTFTSAYGASMAESAAKKAKTTRDPHEAAAGASSVAGKVPTASAPAIGGSKERVTGTKVTTINVNIGKLVDNFTISTTNLVDSAGKVRQELVKAMLASINDAQLIATD